MSSFEANLFQSVVFISICFQERNVTLQVQILSKLLSNWSGYSTILLVWKLNLPAWHMKAGIPLLNRVFKCRR